MGFMKKLQKERTLEIAGLLLLGVSVLLFLALVTDGYRGEPERPLALSEIGNISNLLGKPGAITAGVLAILVGHAAHVIYFLTGVWSLMLLHHKPLDRILSRLSGFFIVLASIAVMLHLDLSTPMGTDLPGGVIGGWLAKPLSVIFGHIPANVVAVTLALVGVLLATEFLFVEAAKKVAHMTKILLCGIVELSQGLRRVLAARAERKLELRIEDGNGERVTKKSWKKKKADLCAGDDTDLSRINVYTDSVVHDDVKKAKEKIKAARQDAESAFDELALVQETAAKPAAEQLELISEEEKPAEPKPRIKKSSGSSKPVLRRKMQPIEELPDDYEYPKRYTKPPLDILEYSPKLVIPNLNEQLRETSVLLEETLRTFGIESRVTDVTRGPTITRFEIEPAPGIKVSRFLALADDIALALKAHRVRVEAPIPGKGRVGIEVPNTEREGVNARDLFESRKFRRSKKHLTLALGKDIAGDVLTANLESMPHLLVAGATGSGKTVCIKTLLASLLFAKTPEELQLLLIDPKMVELSTFQDIPHLITPVVTDPKKAAAALNWLIVEMEERYRLFAHLRVRNIEVYNESVSNGEIEMECPDGGEQESVEAIRKLPYIVCVIDELADLMMLARAEVEDAIGRLAQLARAVGIHLIIATQRPSVDVLTGVIKANFPTRVSFQVSSRVDSRCILDEIGAERLIGQGDMLYLPPGQSKPIRIQGAFVSDDEMHALIAYLKTQAPPQYRDEIESHGTSKDTFDILGDDADELFDDAVQVVLDTGQASISMVQRRLRVGYTRAARLIDMMELKGVVGPHLGSKPRDILVDVPQNSDEVA